MDVEELTTPYPPWVKSGRRDPPLERLPPPPRLWKPWPCPRPRNIGQAGPSPLCGEEADTDVQVISVALRCTASSCSRERRKWRTPWEAARSADERGKAQATRPVETKGDDRRTEVKEREAEGERVAS